MAAYIKDALAKAEEEKMRQASMASQEDDEYEGEDLSDAGSMAGLEVDEVSSGTAQGKHKKKRTSGGSLFLAAETAPVGAPATTAPSD